MKIKLLSPWPWLAWDATERLASLPLLTLLVQLIYLATKQPLCVSWCCWPRQPNIYGPTWPHGQSRDRCSQCWCWSNAHDVDRIWVFQPWSVIEQTKKDIKNNRSKLVAIEGVGIFNRTQINPQEHGYRCSFHLGVFQSIVFIHRETMVKEVNNSPSCIY